jgi:hypothetical protein
MMPRRFNEIRPMKHQLRFGFDTTQGNMTPFKPPYQGRLVLPALLSLLVID